MKKIIFVAFVMLLFSNIKAQANCKEEEKSALIFFLLKIYPTESIAGKKISFNGIINNKYSEFLFSRTCFQENRKSIDSNRVDGLLADSIKVSAFYANNSNSNFDSCNIITIPDSLKHFFVSKNRKRDFVVDIFRATSFKKCNYVRIRLTGNEGAINYFFEFSKGEITRWCKQKVSF